MIMLEKRGGILSGGEGPMGGCGGRSLRVVMVGSRLEQGEKISFRVDERSR